MSKKVCKIVVIIIFILLVAVGVIMFTDLGSEIRTYLFDTIFTPKENVKIEGQKHIKITYKYSWKAESESFDIDVIDENLVKMIEDNILNKKLNNYSAQIGLTILGQYEVNLENNVRFYFDNYDDDGYVIMYDDTKDYLTKINPEILEKVVQIVDEKLTEQVEQFKTNKISITKTEKGENDTIIKKENIDVNEKTAIEYIINQCKKIYVKDIDYEPNIVHPDYEIDFNNNIKLWIYNENDRGWMYKDGSLLEAYGLDNFDTFIKNSFSDLELKKQMFTAKKISIISPNKQIELTDEESVERITTVLIYSKLYRPEWLENYDIKEEYDTGIKVKVNNNEFLIPGEKVIANRYVIDEDNKISLCFTLTSIEQYINNLLGIR